MYVILVFSVQGYFNKRNSLKRFRLGRRLFQLKHFGENENKKIDAGTSTSPDTHHPTSLFSFFHCCSTLGHICVCLCMCVLFDGLFKSRYGSWYEYFLPSWCECMGCFVCDEHQHCLLDDRKCVVREWPSCLILHVCLALAGCMHSVCKETATCLKCVLLYRARGVGYHQHLSIIERFSIFLL